MALRAAKQSHKLVASLNAGGCGAGVARLARSVDLTRRNA
jgi:hypothetical protein